MALFELKLNSVSNQNIQVILHMFAILIIFTIKYEYAQPVSKSRMQYLMRLLEEVVIVEVETNFLE